MWVRREVQCLSNFLTQQDNIQRCFNMGLIKGSVDLNQVLEFLGLNLKTVLIWMKNAGENDVFATFVDLFTQASLACFDNYNAPNITVLSDAAEDNLLHIAARHGYVYAIYPLVRTCQADPSITNGNHQTPSDVAIENGHEEFVASLQSTIKQEMDSWQSIAIQTSKIR